MAGVTSSSDAEAVVNSIRLLVAEQAPVIPAPASTPVPPPASTPRPAPLLLLPAFRVGPRAASPAAAAPMTLEQRIATLEAQLSGLQEAAAAEPPPSAAAGAPAPDRATVTAVIEEALIDEDSLREIVAGLVREELRGELGERITRNVRRMIRRELHQALALIELESRSEPRPAPARLERDED